MRDTRIQKAMADQGLCSRRQAEQIILEGRVKLNGRPVQLGDKMDIRADILSRASGKHNIEKDYRGDIFTDSRPKIRGLFKAYGFKAGIVESIAGEIAYAFVIFKQVYHNCLLSLWARRPLKRNI